MTDSPNYLVIKADIPGSVDKTNGTVEDQDREPGIPKNSSGVLNVTVCFSVQ